MKPVLEGSNTCEDWEWEDLCNDLTELMKAVNPAGLWRGRVEGFGWRSVDGQRGEFAASCGSELLLAILPNTDCNFKIYKWGRKGFKIDNAHHDKPCGGEWYFIEKA